MCHGGPRHPFDQSMRPLDPSVPPAFSRYRLVHCDSLAREESLGICRIQLACTIDPHSLGRSPNFGEHFCSLHQRLTLESHELHKQESDLCGPKKEVLPSMVYAGSINHSAWVQVEFRTRFWDETAPGLAQVCPTAGWSARTSIWAHYVRLFGAGKTLILVTQAASK